MIAELGAALAMCASDGQTRTGHAGKKQRRVWRNFDQASTRLKLFGKIAHKPRPELGAGNEFVQARHHLTSITYTKRERIIAREEAGEFVPHPGIKQNGFRPPLARA